MTEKYQNKYRIPSARLQRWNYSWAGAYFITICTKYRLHYFGEIKNGKMMLNEIGEMVQNEWMLTPIIRPDMNLDLGEFVVMPNHFHGILIIGENKFNGNGGNGTDAMHCVCTPSPSSTPTVTTNQFGPQRKNMASIIRGFKSSVTKNARIINPDFAWQPRFYDHIIRDDKSFNNISNYIIKNPEHWDKDTFYGKI
jgi:putative transposase